MFINLLKTILINKFENDALWIAIHYAETPANKNVTVNEVNEAEKVDEHPPVEE